MNVLFLDDNPYRRKTFLLKNLGATCVETAAECIAALQEKSWDIVHLDHDLGGETYVDSTLENCGMEVVRFLCRNKKNIDKIIVHSYNNYAAQNMTTALRNNGYDVEYIPFGLKDE